MSREIQTVRNANKFISRLEESCHTETNCIGTALFLAGMIPKEKYVSPFETAKYLTKDLLIGEANCYDGTIPEGTQLIAIVEGKLIIHLAYVDPLSNKKRVIERTRCGGSVQLDTIKSLTERYGFNYSFGMGYYRLGFYKSPIIFSSSSMLV